MSHAEKLVKDLVNVPGGAVLYPLKGKPFLCVGPVTFTYVGFPRQVRILGHSQSHECILGQPSLLQIPGPTTALPFRLADSRRVFGGLHVRSTVKTFKFQKGFFDTRPRSPLPSFFFLRHQRGVPCTVRQNRGICEG